jgi:hypothetical protein
VLTSIMTGFSVRGHGQQRSRMDSPDGFDFGRHHIDLSGCPTGSRSAKGHPCYYYSLAGLVAQ